MAFTSLGALIRGQFKVTRFRSQSRLAYWAKLVVLALGLVGLFAASIAWDWKIVSADGLLAGIAILAGGFLAAFTHLSGVRQTLDARQKQSGAAEAPERDLVDVAVTRLLGATLVSVVTSAVLVIGASVSTDKHGHVTGLWAAATWTGSALSMVLFIAAVGVLYSAYVQMNRVDPDLDGSRQW